MFEFLGELFSSDLKSARAHLRSSANAPSAQRCLALARRIQGYKKFEDHREIRDCYAGCLVNGMARPEPAALDCFAQAQEGSVLNELRVARHAAAALRRAIRKSKEPQLARELALKIPLIPEFESDQRLQETFAAAAFSLTLVTSESTAALEMWEQVRRLSSLKESPEARFQAAKLLCNAAAFAQDEETRAAALEGFSELGLDSPQIQEALLHARGNARQEGEPYLYGEDPTEHKELDGWVMYAPDFDEPTARLRRYLKAPSQRRRQTDGKYRMKVSLT